MGDNGIGLAEALVGLDGFRVLDVAEADGEVMVRVETTAELMACPECGRRAESQDRMERQIRDLPCFGRPARLVWWVRRWRCRSEDCPAKTWTETSVHISARTLLTQRAGWEVTRQVGAHARPVAQLAREFGVEWWTIMRAVAEHGTPLVEDPARVGQVASLGLDETSFLRANRRHPTSYVTAFVDLDRRVMVDLVEGNEASDVREWLEGRHPAWRQAVQTVALDLAESYRAGLSPHLDHAQRVADPFHVVRVANRCLDSVRRRVQQETKGHRGRADDPLYRIRKLLLKGSERLDQMGSDRMLLGLRYGDPADEVLGAWLAKESVRDVYLTEEPTDAATLLDKAITGCSEDHVSEIQALGRTLSRWRTEILAHHETGASNGPTEALNLLVKKVKRSGHGFQRFEHYRLRVLLHTGGIDWNTPSPPPLRGRSPHSNA
ncbi:MAG: ISL3 family transposase [Acidimicrobiia bacterium]